MKLLTKAIRNKLPALRSTDNSKGQAIVWLKLFDPCGSWTWYAWEGEDVKDDHGNIVDYQCFGLVCGFEKELGYFSLVEIASVKGPLGLGIERDMYWTPITVAELLRKEGLGSLADAIESRDDDDR